MIRLLLLLLLIPSLCFADGNSENTIGGYTASAHLIQVSGDTLTPSPYLNFTGGVTGSTTNGITTINVSGGGGSSGLNVGTTTIANGTNGYVEYNNNGVLGEEAVSGTGTVTSITALSPLSGGTITTAGNVGIGTALGSISTFGVTGNVGIGSATPGQTLDVKGTVRATNFIGAGTGLTGTASALSIGGNAATATSATNFSGSLSGDVTGSQSSTSVVKVNGLAVPTSKTIVGTNSSGQFVDASSATLANNTSGNAATATALAANGTNCASGHYPLGVDASGNSESCTTAPTECSSSSCSLNASTTLNGTAISTQTFGTLTNTDWCSSNGTNISCTQTAPQVALSLVKGTYVDGDVCTYTASGTLLNCNTAASGGTNYWSLTAAAGNVGISTTNTVGIGTTSGNAALTIMNGNVGLGTWNPSNILDVVGGVGIGTSGADIYVTSTVPVGELVVEKNVGIGTIAPNKSLCVGSTCQANIDSSGNGFYTGSLTTTYNTLDNGSGAGHFAGGLTTQFNTLDNGTTGGAYFKGNVGIGTTNPVGGLAVMNGNVGIGTWVPGATLDVDGSVRLTGFQLGTSTTSGYVLTADSNGVGTWQAATGGGSGLWNTINTNDVYEQNSSTFGNVGIGTSLTTGGRLIVSGGNVGIGTTLPAYALDVEGTLSTANFGGGAVAPSYNTTIYMDNRVYPFSSTGLQKAENALPSTGGTIYCPHGTYTFTTTVNITVPTTFIGEGIGGPAGYFGGSWNNVTQTLFTLGNSVNLPMFLIETTGGGTQHGSGGGMYHIGIYGNYDNNTSPTGDLINFVNWSDYMMWDLVILHATYNTTYYAISADANSWNIEFDEVQIEDSLGSGMKLLGHRFWLKDEHFRNVTGDAIFNTYNGSGTNESGLSVDGLDCYDNGQRCINLSGGSYANISNVWLNSNSQSSSNTYDGIYIQSSTNSVTLSNINFQDTSIRYGINVSDSGSSNINGTTINFMSAPATSKTNVNASATAINLEYGVPNGVNFSTGNVGINSATPGVELDVQGTSRFTSAGSSSPAILVPVGNVSIGSSNPAHLLEVNSSAASDAVQVYAVNTNASGIAGGRVENSSGVGFDFVSTGSSYAVPNLHGILTDASNNLSFGNTSGSIFETISAAGNVGIGTVNPIATFDLNGSMHLVGIGTTGGSKYLCVTSGNVVVAQSTAC